MNKPSLSESTIVLPGAHVVGNVTVGEESSIWYNCAIRAEEGTITIGARTNIQDNSVMHVEPGEQLVVGDDVTVAHGCILHGCTIHDRALVGVGSIVMDGAVLGKDCIIGAASFVPAGMVLPDGMVAYGSPAKVVRPATEEEKAHFLAGAGTYVKRAKLHNNLY